MSLVNLKIELSRNEYNLISYLGEPGQGKKKITEVIIDHANVGELDKLVGETVVSMEIEIPIKLAAELEQTAEEKSMSLSEYTRSVVATYTNLQIEINAARKREREENVRVGKGVQMRFNVTGELFEKYETVFGRTGSSDHSKVELNKKNTLIALEKGLDALIKEK